jgi:hypothetical protein
VTGLRGDVDVLRDARHVTGREHPRVAGALVGVDSERPALVALDAGHLESLRDLREGRCPAHNCLISPSDSCWLGPCGPIWSSSTRNTPPAETRASRSPARSPASGVNGASSTVGASSPAVGSDLGGLHGLAHATDAGVERLAEPGEDAGERVVGLLVSRV